MSGVVAPQQDAYPYHTESHGRIRATAEHVFEHLDDHARLAAHMGSDPGPGRDPTGILRILQFRTPLIQLGIYAPGVAP